MALLCFLPRSHRGWLLRIMSNKAKALKVYGLRGWRSDCPPAANGNRQTREIVAATSKAAAMRAFGCSRYEMDNHCSVTGNEAEIALATSKPGTVFWIPLDGRWQNKHEWREAE
jgi:hypothetical protein